MYFHAYWKLFYVIIVQRIVIILVRGTGRKLDKLCKQFICFISVVHLISTCK